MDVAYRADCADRDAGFPRQAPLRGAFRFLAGACLLLAAAGFGACSDEKTNQAQAKGPASL